MKRLRHERTPEWWGTKSQMSSNFAGCLGCIFGYLSNRILWHLLLKFCLFEARPEKRDRCLSCLLLKLLMQRHRRWREEYLATANCGNPNQTESTTNQLHDSVWEIAFSLRRIRYCWECLRLASGNEMLKLTLNNIQKRKINKAKK